MEPNIPDFKLPPSGTHVRVERDSGEVQLGWNLAGELPLSGKIRVIHELPVEQRQSALPVGQRRSEYKDLSRSEFIRTNPIPGIDDVNDFDQLKEAIKRVSFVQGSQTTYKSGDLIKLVDEVREGKRPLEEITRTGSLRDKTQELLRRG